MVGATDQPVSMFVVAAASAVEKGTTNCDAFAVPKVFERINPTRDCVAASAWTTISRKRARSVVVVRMAQ